MAHTVEDVMIIITWPWSTRPSLVGEIRQEITLAGKWHISPNKAQHEAYTDLAEQKGLCQRCRL